MKKSCPAFLAYFVFAILSLGYGSLAHAEEYIGILVGYYDAADTTVTATQSQLICLFPPCSSSVTNKVHFDRGHSAGIRYGFWWSDYFGAAAEFTSSGVNNSNTPITSPGVTQVEVNYESIALILMLRTHMLKTEYLPDSYLYGGVGPSSTHGRISVVTQQLAPISGDVNTNSIILVAGGAVQFFGMTLFAEWRTQDLNFNFSYLGSSANPRVSTSEKMFGVAYRF